MFVKLLFITKVFVQFLYIISSNCSLHCGFYDLKWKKVKGGAAMAHWIGENCIGCGACARSCPVHAIEGAMKQRHAINARALRGLRGLRHELPRGRGARTPRAPSAAACRPRRGKNRSSTRRCAAPARSARPSARQRPWPSLSRAFAATWRPTAS